ncbi:MAG: hypothetical protein Q7S82_01785 [bacterium]|nr:hypothetical protein [bacterium]
MSSGTVVLSFTIIKNILILDHKVQYILLFSWILFLVTILAGIIFEHTLVNTKIKRVVEEIDKLECESHKFKREIEEEQDMLLKKEKEEKSKLHEIILKEKQIRFWQYFNNWVVKIEKIQKVTFILGMVLFSIFAIILLLMGF